MLEILLYAWNILAWMQFFQREPNKPKQKWILLTKIVKEKQNFRMSRVFFMEKY
jgi:hypothetical protein